MEYSLDHGQEQSTTDEGFLSKEQNTQCCTRNRAFHIAGVGRDCLGEAVLHLTLCSDFNLHCNVESFVDGRITNIKSSSSSSSRLQQSSELRGVARRITCETCYNARWLALSTVSYTHRSFIRPSTSLYIRPNICTSASRTPSTSWPVLTNGTSQSESVWQRARSLCQSVCLWRCMVVRMDSELAITAVCRQLDGQTRRTRLLLQRQYTTPVYVAYWVTINIAAKTARTI